MTIYEITELDHEVVRELAPDFISLVLHLYLKPLVDPIEHPFSHLTTSIELTTINMSGNKLDEQFAKGMFFSVFYYWMALFFLCSNILLGHEVPVSHQSTVPGKQHDLPGKAPVNDQLPTDEGGYQLYKAAGKLAGKKALITGGDSGIGRAVAILFAMEGAETTIVYLPEEEKDAKETERLVTEKGEKCHLISADLKSHQACKNVVQKAIAAMGRVGILVLNHGTQMMQPTIDDLTE